MTISGRSYRPCFFIFIYFQAPLKYYFHCINLVSLFYFHSVHFLPSTPKECFIYLESIESQLDIELCDARANYRKWLKQFNVHKLDEIPNEDDKKTTYNKSWYLLQSYYIGCDTNIRSLLQLYLEVFNKMKSFDWCKDHAQDEVYGYAFNDNTVDGNLRICFNKMLKHSKHVLDVSYKAVMSVESIVGSFSYLNPSIKLDESYTYVDKNLRSLRSHNIDITAEALPATRNHNVRPVQSSSSSFHEGDISSAGIKTSPCNTKVDDGDQSNNNNISDLTINGFNMRYKYTGHGSPVYVDVVSTNGGERTNRRRRTTTKKNYRSYFNTVVKKLGIEFYSNRPEVIIRCSNTKLDLPAEVHLVKADKSEVSGMTPKQIKSYTEGNVGLETNAEVDRYFRWKLCAMYYEVDMYVQTDMIKEIAERHMSPFVECPILILPNNKKRKDAPTRKEDTMPPEM